MSRKSPDQMTGPSYDAARKLHDRGGTLRSVSAEHGVSHQAVDYAWGRLYPGELTPYRKRTEERRLEVLELARSGLYASEIARRTKSQPERVAALCREAGVELQSGVTTTPEMEAAVQLVASGMAVVEAAHAAGVSYGHLSALALKRGIAAPPPRPRGGRSVRAARRVLAGERVCDAARAEQCTPASVCSSLLRLRAINAGSREP